MNLEQLDTWLYTLEPAPRVNSTSMLDGVLPAIVIGPCSIPPDEWFVDLLGERGRIATAAGAMLAAARVCSSHRASTRPCSRRPATSWRCRIVVHELSRRHAAAVLWRFSRLRPCKYLNNFVEQDHSRIKRLVRPGLGFGSMPRARRTLAGYEAMAMIRKGQVRNVDRHDMQAQTAFVAGLFQMAA